MAVALLHLEAQRRGFIRKQKVKLLKFFGKCQMPNGSVTILAVKALDATEASKQLHKGYCISMVLDILTESQMAREWDKIKPSLIQRSQLR